MKDDAKKGGPAWRVFVDTGGTFTDCLAIDPSGAVHRAKVLSSSAIRTRILAIDQGAIRVDPHFAAHGPALRGMRVRAVLSSGEESQPILEVAEADTRQGLLHLGARTPSWPTGTLIELFADEEAPILAARLITRTSPGERLPPIRMRLGTTRGTNALLERRGAPTALFITQGFGDLLEIGTQQRPDLFALNIIKPAQLYSAVVEVPGRLSASGQELAPLELGHIAREAGRLKAEGIQAVAVALMHSWNSPAHEAAVADVLHAAGFEHVCCSASLSPSIRILPRSQTAVVDAYLAPVVADYLTRITNSLASAGSSLHAMTSAGGLAGSREFRPKDSLLSGPAGGVIGAAAEGKAAGFDRIIAFDMGGTSTDVSRFDGVHDYTFEHQVGDARIVAHALAIESVAAGGGSVCWVDDGTLKVGPQSAGASPGPACYGAGGPLTITDCNLLLGRLDPAGFQIPIDDAPARARARELIAQLPPSVATPSVEALAEGFIHIANERMAEAITLVSTRRGYNPREYALLCFGGAGGQHACEIAQKLGIGTVVVPQDAGLLSAAGLARASIERIAERQVLEMLERVSSRLGSHLAELDREAAARVAKEEDSATSIRITRRLATLRLLGQDTGLTLDLPDSVDETTIAALFCERYAAVYGHRPPARPIELESLRVVAAAPPPSEDFASRPTPNRTAPRFGRVCFAGECRDMQVLSRDAIGPGDELVGPALIRDPHSTTILPPGWRARVHDKGSLVLTADPASFQKGTVIRAAQEEIHSSRLAAIAEDMGEMLRRTALSTNVKERLDFSCAILDADGQLVVNAPHIPVHLGALGVCVRRVDETLRMEPGDVVVTNHPGFGGSHLPDVTLITPVFASASTGAPTRIAYVACRAHHAEIGGTRPGSMPTDARSLVEEGVVIPPMYLVRGSQDQWSSLEHLLRSAPHPSRAVDENLADLRAQVAANQRGVTEITAFAAANGIDALRAAMSGLTLRARRLARQIVARLHEQGGTFSAEERLDDGSLIRVAIHARPDSITIDFTGSAGIRPGNLNATGAIIRSAVMYVLRLMSAEALPLNEGLLAPVDLRIPPGMLNPGFAADPHLCPAVAGGNVETSQRVVDTLLKALGLCACSQGTMNNTLFGNDRFGYYETVCGGAGAGPGFSGASAVHTHMTNTRITDPEILEHRYPVRLHRFCIRQGSGGTGQHRGGDGVIRELEFLAPCSLSILAQHRNAGPFGAAGGDPGLPGAQHLIQPDGSTTSLSGNVSCSVVAGTHLVLQTPGGGGWGKPGPRC